MTNAFDVIGDVHGHASELEAMLTTLGYKERGGAYRHPERKVIFLGDLIDRGAAQLRTLEIARSMVEAGSAQLVLGNHEFNALAWATRNEAGEWARPHNDKNRRQHEAFLAAVGENSPRHRDWLAWFRDLPMWLDVGGLRIVHACWDQSQMGVLGDGCVTDEIIAAPKGSPAYEAVEVVLKGPEIDLAPLAYLDKDGNRRSRARRRWWDPAATTLATAALIPNGVTTPDGEPFPDLPDDPVAPLAVEDAAGPVLYGHYWRSGAPPHVDGPTAACLDWSVAKGGPLVAYRWSGEQALTDANLVATPPRTNFGR